MEKAKWQYRSYGGGKDLHLNDFFRLSVLYKIYQQGETQDKLCYVCYINSVKLNREFENGKDAQDYVIKIAKESMKNALETIENCE